MNKIRFIDLETHSAFQNMAIDEAVMQAIRDEKAPPTLRLYRWKPSAVSIGTFQGMKEEVDLDYCKKNGIDYIRRITGGGAVYHDYEGEITYSIILPKDHNLVKQDIFASYKILCGGIVEALNIMNIDAEFKPINDIVAGGKKISGNAQTRRHSCVLQHGTTLLDLDVEVMFSVLKVPKEKISDKMIADVKQRVTSIRDLLGWKVDFSELKNAMRQGFAKALNANLEEGSLTPEESQKAEQLASEKYATDKWNLSR